MLPKYVVTLVMKIPMTDDRKNPCSHHKCKPGLIVSLKYYLPTLSFAVVTIFQIVKIKTLVAQQRVKLNGDNMDTYKNVFVCFAYR